MIAAPVSFWVVASPETGCQKHICCSWHRYAPLITHAKTYQEYHVSFSWLLSLMIYFWDQSRLVSHNILRSVVIDWLLLLENAGNWSLQARSNLESWRTRQIYVASLAARATLNSQIWSKTGICIVLGRSVIFNSSCTLLRPCSPYYQSMTSITYLPLKYSLYQVYCSPL
jgi:hypothetical protein